MTHIYLLHPDAALRDSLKQTLTSVWKDLQCTDYGSAEDLPDVPDANAVVLGLEKPRPIPDNAFFSLDMKQPIRLSQMLRQLETLLQNRKTPPLLPVKNAVLDTRSREWQVNESIVDLTEKEVATILYLWHATAPVTREDLLRDVWAYAPDTDTHTIETHIYRLRQKIEKDPGNPEYLLTEKNGYQLAARSSA